MVWSKKIFRFKFSNDERLNHIMSFHLNTLFGTEITHNMARQRKNMFMELRFWIKHEEVKGKQVTNMQGHILELMTRHEMRYRSYYPLTEDIIKILETKNWEKIGCLLIDVTNS